MGQFAYRAVRAASANAKTTEVPTGGVVRDYKPLPVSSVYQPLFSVLDVPGDQYRTAILNSPLQGETEYLLWAANGGSLSVGKSPVVLKDGTGAIPTGIIINPGNTYFDGSDSIIVMGGTGRTITTVVQVEIVRGDLQGSPLIVTTFASVSLTGRVTFDAATLLLLDGGVFHSRGDYIQSVWYQTEAAKFWWTRNDPQKVRFGLNNAAQRWEPLKGSSVKNLGLLRSGSTYVLSPNPDQLNIGDVLPGTYADPDAYSMVRIGQYPDSDSDPIAADGPGAFTGIQMVSDAQAEDTTFVWGTQAAIMGETSGFVQWNPAFLMAYAGQSVWYVPQEFEVSLNGFVDNLLVGNHIHIAPIPGLSDYPFIRVGTRRYLTARVVATEALQTAITPAIDEVVVAVSTGRLKFNAGLLAKADPTNPAFDVQYLGAEVFYDGVALNQEPLPTQDAVALTGPLDDLYVPSADLAFGIGTSGILHLPDQTGLPPQAGTPGIRPGGDTLTATATGLVRQIETFGDLLIFGNTRVLKKVHVVDTEDDAPAHSFRIPMGEAYLARDTGRVFLSRKDQSDFSGEQLYLLQALCRPSVYVPDARVYSRLAEPFSLEGGEKLYFAQGSTAKIWTSTLGAGDFSAAQVVANILTQTAPAPTAGSVLAVGGKILLTHSTAIEIGWGSVPGVKDLSGARALGLLPGWQVTSAGGWLPDSGFAYGLGRSPVNLDRTGPEADILAEYRATDLTLSRSVTGQPFTFLDQLPIQDVAGYNDDIFYQLLATIKRGDTEYTVRRELENFVDVKYDFGQKRFFWLEEHAELSLVQQPTSTLFLGQLNIVPETMYLPNNGVWVSRTGGAYTKLVYDEEFTLPNSGIPGTALLINRVGDEFLSGARGQFVVSSTSFTDPDADFTAVQAGYILKIQTGTAAGSYVILSKTPTSLTVTPAFASSSSSALPTEWVVYEGHPRSTYDATAPVVLADVMYREFNHLSTEPFKVYALSLVGDVPPDAATQQANRLIADAGEALEKGREISLWMGLSDTTDWTVYVLQQSLLGDLANNSLFVDPVDPRVLVESFGLRVGGQLFSFTDVLHPISMVGAFSVPIPNGSIECLTTTGEVGFAADLLVDYQGAEVYYQEIFLDPSAFLTGTVELDPETGGLNFCDDDLATYGGQEAYFNERMITEHREDVAISPVVGTFAFNKPLKAWQAVWVDYYLADVSGDKALDDAGAEIHVQEFLPVYVQQEVCTVTASPYVVAFNPTGRQVFSSIEPTIYVGAYMMNYAYKTAVVQGNTVVLDAIPAVGDAVTISYAVLQSFGGDTTYTSSQTPIYRPPFFLEAGQDTFTLDGDRTSEVQVGCLLRLGEAPFYITSSVYASSVTTVTVYPTPVNEAGSRAPGNDALTLLSTEPVDVPNFLWVTPGLEYEKVPRKGRSITVKGDLLRYAIAGHLMEVEGLPFIIAGARLDETGTKTIVEWTSIAPVELSGSTFRISVRPIYPPSARDFLGLSSFVAEEPYELILFGNGIPGRTLIPGIEYAVDPATGNVSLLAPVQEPLQPGQWLYFRYTGLDTLAPVYQSGVLVMPRVFTRFSFTTTPTTDNGLLGSYLQATFSFRNPDTFYAKLEPMASLLSEISLDSIEKIKSRQPSSGPILPSNTAFEFGGVSLTGEWQELQNEDRAARSFLTFYNETISTFEQVQEAIGSGIVGDRDGKFKFLLGPETEVAGPGSEDDISGLLNPRNLWSEVFLQLRGNSPVYVLTTDPIVSPSGVSLSGGVLDGKLPNIDDLKEWMQAQRGLVENEVDDILLTGLTKLKRVGGSWIPHFQALGRFLPLADPGSFSRLFPEEATVFATTSPGIGADETIPEAGEYAFAKIIDLDGTVASTFLTPIGEVANPVLGTVQNIQSITVSDRYPRARIWAYSAVGFPELDATIDAYTTLGPNFFASNPRPAVIATPLLLKDFPLTADNLPDVTQFVSLGGALADLESGDYDLHTPGFRALPDAQVGFGRPEGVLFDVGYGAIVVPFEDPVTAPVYIEDVILGCILTFKAVYSTTTASVTDGSIFVQFDGGVGGPPVSLLEGDTVYLHVPGRNEMEDVTDPLTTEDMERVAKGLPVYRDGYDIGVNKKTGDFVDITFPSAFQRIFGQKPPQPVSQIEARVQFTNSALSPLEIPALLGQDKNDSGDYTIPYLKTRNTELDRLGNVDTYIGDLFLDNSVGTSGVYPDEFVGTDGAVFGAGDDYPATLQTAVDVFPAFSLGSGLGTLAPSDLLFIQTGGVAIPAGCQGILSVGRVEEIAGTTYIENPRFVTPTTQGDPISYTFDNIQAFVQDPQPVILNPASTQGVRVLVDTGAGTTLFDFSSVPIADWAVLHDGLVSGSGGLNTIWAAGVVPNKIILRLYQRELGGGQGTPVQTITFEGAPATVTGDNGTFAITSALFGVGLGARSITVDSAAFISLAPPNPLFPFFLIGPGLHETTYQYDYTISVDTYNGGTGYSVTGYVASDRLTFAEVVDTSTVKVRGTTHPKSALTSIEGRLQVLTVTGPSWTDMTVNSVVNGGVPFTFLERAYGTGEWTPATGPGDELGTIRVMSFEGDNNTPLLGTDAVFSAIPSSAYNATGAICSGAGAATRGYDWLSGVTALSGGIANVEPGDILVISEAFPYGATAKAGTYIVRHGVEPNNLPLDTRDLVMSSVAGGSAGWVDIQFPTLVSWDSLLGTVTISDTFPFAASPTGHGFKVGGTPFIFFLTQVAGPLTKLVYAAYTGIGGNTFTLNVAANFWDENNNLVSDPDFWNSLSVGMLVSGMSYFPVNAVGAGLPDSNVVGGGASVGAVHGFTGITVQSEALTQEFDIGAGTLVLSPPGVNEVGIGLAPVSTSEVFLSDPETVVYAGVPGLLDFSQLSVWACHTNPGVRCFVPGDRLYTSTVASPLGFHAQAGIFLEPSMPMSALNLGGGDPLVVDDAHSLLLSQVGFRDDPAHLGAPEAVAFQVRRIRRFHEVQTLIGEALYPLRYAYYVRTGTVTGYVSAANNKGLYVVEASAGTNLGAFDDEDVNIHAGDTFRVSYSGQVHEATIASVVDGTHLLLAAPGLSFIPIGMDFEIYLKQTPVPHVQSNEQLLALATSETVVERQANYGTGEGGSVPTVNVLEDTTMDLSDVEVGDILVVDPAGALAGQTGPAVPLEYGLRPYGDQAVAERFPGPYVAGKPSELDDNRGFYRVEEKLTANSLRVSFETSFSGGGSSPVVFGGVGYEYSVYPTIHASTLPGGPTEGQMDLRPTLPAGSVVPNSFKGTDYSVEPFSYRVIRPSGLFSEEAVDLILFMRERMLSWLEQLGVMLNGDKHGSYFVFQRDTHIGDLGDPAVPDLGLGVIANALVQGLRGLVATNPFANDRDCLSLLDRRFWILDRRLDYLGYSDYEGTGASVRPVLPDLVDLVLEFRDDMRQQRYFWLDYRTNRVSGTLAAIKRFNQEYAQRVKDKENLALMLRSNP